MITSHPVSNQNPDGGNSSMILLDEGEYLCLYVLWSCEVRLGFSDGFDCHFIDLLRSVALP